MAFAAILTDLDSHQLIAVAGLVAVDFDDGCLLNDFDRSTIRLIGLDEQRPGPFDVQTEHLPRSRCYLAPGRVEPGQNSRQAIHRILRWVRDYHLLSAP